MNPNQNNSNPQEFPVIEVPMPLADFAGPEAQAQEQPITPELEEPVVPKGSEEPGGESPKEESPDMSGVFGGLSDELGIPVQSVDDVARLVNELKSQKAELEGKDPFGDLPEFVRKGVEFALKSDNPQDAIVKWATIQGKDYNALLKKNPESLIVEGLREEFGDALDDAGIKALFEDKFPELDEDSYPDEASFERAMNIRRAKIVSEAKKYADQLNAMKAEKSIPDATKREKEQQKLQTQAAEKYRSALEEAVKTLHGQGIDIDGVNYDIEIVDKKGKLTDAAKPAYQAIQDPIKWLNDNLWNPELGQPDPHKLFRLVYLASNYKSIAETVGKAKKSEGILDILKGVENPTEQKSKRPDPGGGGGLSSSRDIAQAMGFMR